MPWRRLFDDFSAGPSDFHARARGFAFGEVNKWAIAISFFHRKKTYEAKAENIYCGRGGGPAGPVEVYIFRLPKQLATKVAKP